MLRPLEQFFDKRNARFTQERENFSVLRSTSRNTVNLIYTAKSPTYVGEEKFGGFAERMFRKTW